MARSSSFQRNLDRTLGIPAIRVLAVGRQRRALPSAPARIGVIQPTAIGDAILSSGVVKRLSEAFPSAALWVLHGVSNAAAVAMIDATFQREVVGFGRPDKALAALQAKKFDLLVDLTPWPRATALVSRLSGAVSAGFDSFGQARGDAFDLPVEHSCQRHELENFAAMADTVAGPGPYATALKRGWPAPKIALPFERLVLAHPCPGGSQAGPKSWPVAHWAAFVQALTAEGFVVGLTGAKADQPTVDRILAAAGRPGDQALSLVGALSLAELAAAMEAARLVVSVDTGVMHLAAALEVPLIALHGPTRPERWGPVSKAARACVSPHPAAGYINFGYETHPEADAVMAALPPEQVIALAAELLTSA
jgi:ADP-heptose:LPS heptosyltransferase